MVIYCPRRYYSLSKILITVITSLFFLFPIFYIIQNPIDPIFAQIQDTNKILFTNQSLASSLTYQIETTDSYPYLPIQIYTKNRDRFLNLENKTKKVILLGTKWFNEIWPIPSLINNTNSGNMSSLYCSFLNDYCEITDDMTRFKEADGVIYHMRDYVNRSNELMKHRHSSQRFIFTLMETPVNSPDFQLYNNFFNWTMTYRFDSHIFATYYFSDAYRSKAKNELEKLLFDYQFNEEKLVVFENINVKRKKGTAAALISNCAEGSKKRWLIIQELQKYIDVTVYGKCGIPCPEPVLNKKIDCRTYIAENYYFILTFENSYCQDYVTEKLFNTLVLPVVPVVFGRINYTRYIPASGFIDFDQYSSIIELAHRLIQIRDNLTLYEEYFHWKKHFTWGGFSHYLTPFCDLCLRLHLDKTPSIIENIHSWWFDKTCQPQVTKYF